MLARSVASQVTPWDIAASVLLRSLGSGRRSRHIRSRAPDVRYMLLSTWGCFGRCVRNCGKTAELERQEKGRTLIVDVLELPLKRGDQVEPHVGMPDVGMIDSLELAEGESVTLLFWRRSAETLDGCPTK